jgi:pyruvate/2-oxoglutarate dehydrogenase complex dihydrolipoamide acyltransferase (E2) component
MPNLGQGMESGTIVRWLKEVGDDVRRGEPVAEIETDKATLEMEAMVTGTLVEVTAGVGSAVAVGAVIAYVE